MKKLSMDELNRLSTEEFKSAEKTKVVIILDNIRSMHNVGSVFRTSDAFAVEKIILCGITARPPHRDIEKSALGATASVVWEYEESTLEAVQKLKENGYQIISIEQTENSHTLEDFEFSYHQPYAIIFGNEVDGVQQEVINQSNHCIEIPQFGTKHSFNVSVTAGIVMWQVFISHLKTK
ncbi:MAG: RNA methyltransferase [Sphingobacteriales bacterium]|nr:RNA methyltransferase [Sphingobacteriales bacterium]